MIIHTSTRDDIGVRSLEAAVTRAVIRVCSFKLLDRLAIIANDDARPARLLFPDVATG